MDEVLALLERDRALHLTQRCSARDLHILEEGLGRRLPAGFRALLARVGGGILYDRHEVFGARRLIVHDIELVPDLLSVRQRLEAEGHHWPDHLIPFHRSQGIVHVMDVSQGEGSTPALSETGKSYPNLPDFLEAVVLSPPGAADLEAR